MKAFLVAAVLGLVSAPAVQQVAAPPFSPAADYDHDIPVVEFDFEHAALPIPHWRIELYEDGRGTYCVVGVGSPACVGSALIQVGKATHQVLLSGQEAVKNAGCETKAHNIADTGKKKLSYGLRMGDIHVSCTFNYSDEEKLNTIASRFQALAETIQMGEMLKHDHRFDHLGLNAKLDSLASEAKEGRAIELQNIAPVLQSISGDDELMDVVRRKAQSLMQDASLRPGK